MQAAELEHTDSHFEGTQEVPERSLKEKTTTLLYFHALTHKHPM